ncbi:MAG TPA: hypothetical protein ENJ79_04160 [Gammaproteobacteria bacterium]|nr:hypothetical protein [Gammaproteobacteria bacterium]
MNKRPHKLILAFCMMLTPIRPGLAADDADCLRALWEQARDGHFLQPDTAAIEHAFEGFVRELAGHPWPEREWRKGGWAVHRLKLGQRACRLLSERPDRREGRGLYLFCPRASAPVVLQLPHSFKDVHTGRIGLALAAQGQFRAVAWNTVPRDQADFAHLEQTPFNALARAVGARPDLHKLIQLHGFARGKRHPDARAAHIILSNGTPHPGLSLLRLADNLRQTLAVDTRVYPRDVQELGATTNRQGRALRRAGHRGFVHIELSAELRKRLRHDAGARARLREQLLYFEEAP